MPNLGVGELALIFMIVMVLFGARRLPEMGAGLGKAIRSFKDALSAPDQNHLDAPRPDADPAKSEARRDEARR